MQRIQIVEIVFCHTHKQFHLSDVTVADPDSSDFTRTGVTGQSNSIPTKFLLNAPKEVLTSKNKSLLDYIGYKHSNWYGHLQ